MKERTETRYVCEICDTDYATAIQAETCETRPLRKMEITIGDRVLWRDDYSGLTRYGTVIATHIYGYLDAPAFKNLWHTVAVEVALDDGVTALINFGEYQRL